MKTAILIIVSGLILASNMYLIKSVQQLSEQEKKAEQQADYIIGCLEKIQAGNDEQYNKTVDIKNTYDNLLSEQKKKTVDITSRDSAVSKIKKDAENYYSKKNYVMAYKEFSKVLSYYNDDLESRLLKAKSLYYINRADSSSYSEILKDITLLKENGMADKEILQIEESIKMELEGLNE